MGRGSAVDSRQSFCSGPVHVDRRVQLEEITRNLKRLAGQLSITIALLSQLNRDVEKRSNPKPIMADLKECGAIEEDADVILVLWDHKKGGIDEPSIKGLGAIKGRDVGQSDMALHFDGKYQRWSESTESLTSNTNTSQALDPTGPDPIALPPDQELLGDLTAPQYKVVTMGKGAAIQINSKDDIRKALGRSPDKGDSVAMTFVGDMPSPRTKPTKPSWRDSLSSRAGHWDQATS